MKNFNYIFLAFTIFLYSCHSSEDYRHSRKNMHIDCQTIEQELNILYAKQQQIDNMDKFSFSNMLVIPAIIRTIKITSQRTEVEQKLDQYKNLKSLKAVRGTKKVCKDNNIIIIIILLAKIIIIINTKIITIIATKIII